ncbi:MAG: sugar phosphate isomerase/epimerase [Victivallaceae bacterium]|nr:sugar phosphate isomerase/epimerase [Victivallaceae bacterium]
MKPLSVQLYSLRAEAQKDFTAVLKKIAGIGYAGVEPAGFWDLSPAEFKKIVTDLGMKVSGSHSPWCRSTDDVNQAIETAGILDVDKVACGYGRDEFKDLDSIKKLADIVNPMQRKLAENGITLFQHNHEFEFERLSDGRLAYEAYLDYCPDIKFEIDTYWSTNFGKEDPYEMLKKFSSRAILLHIKDGDFNLERTMLAAGDGLMNFPHVLEAMDPEVTQWLVVEIDNCKTDMFEAIEKSYNYLTKNGLSKGNR